MCCIIKAHRSKIETSMTKSEMQFENLKHLGSKTSIDLGIDFPFQRDGKVSAPDSEPRRQNLPHPDVTRHDRRRRAHLHPAQSQV